MVHHRSRQSPAPTVDDDDLESLVSTKRKEGNSNSRRICAKLVDNLDDLVTWWFGDIPPLHGPLRFCFYISIFYLEWLGAAGLSAFSVDKCNLDLKKLDYYHDLELPDKHETGFFRLAFPVETLIESIGKGGWLTNCALLDGAMRWGLVLSAVGAGGNISRAVAAISFMTLFALHVSTFGDPVSHNLYMASVALLALCFAEGNLIDGWSVDAQLLRLWRKFRSSSQGNAIDRQMKVSSHSQLSWGGGARKIILFQACVAFFVTGIHKLSSSGLWWLDGGTILYGVHKQQSMMPWLQKLVFRYRAVLLAPMATSAVIMEIGSLAALVHKRWRPFGVALFFPLHIGIMMLMHPNFTMNMVCYILIVDWTHVLAFVRSRFPFPICTVDSTAADQDQMRRQYFPKKTKKEAVRFRVGAMVLTVWAAVMTATGLLQVDYFPFTSWVLYSWHPHGPGFERHHTVQDATEDAKHCLRRPPLSPACGPTAAGQSHMNRWKRTSNREIRTFMITTSVEPSSSGYCRPSELSVYDNWRPRSCYKNTTDLVGLLREVAASRHPFFEPDPVYLHDPPEEVQEDDPDDDTYRKFKRRHKRDPSRLRNAAPIRKGMGWRISDVVAAAIDEGPACFEPVSDSNSSVAAWDADPLPSSIASDYLRKLRNNLNGSYYAQEQQVLAIGIFFEFHTGTAIRQCMIGDSVEGKDRSEPVVVKERKYDADWSEVRTGLILAYLFFSIIVYGPGWVCGGISVNANTNASANAKYERNSSNTR